MVEYIQKKAAGTKAMELARWLTPPPSLKSGLRTKLVINADASWDRGVGNQFGSDGSALPGLGQLSPLGSWASVMATIDRKAQQISGFNPASTSFDDSVWSDYSFQFMTMPFWLFTNQGVKTAQISSLSLQQAVDMVVQMIEPIATSTTTESVITSIKKIGELAMQNEGKAQKQNFQHQGLISVKSGVLYAGFFRAMVGMAYLPNKGYEQLTQLIIVSLSYGILNFAECIGRANDILSWDREDVENWENKTASANFPPNNSPAWGRYSNPN
ncbi:hypothetical protein [Nostoc sp. 2RC]|uniref:hypothetical protein n=1 Tax=Nostoc sp. 2RC TaxID=2485484 RepID=UPI0016296D2D|nr:hypothetical protein [Nostoc sp. 2RC]MBC1241025.1 hypothetical protein [Nostoc sp. 2RC]